MAVSESGLDVIGNRFSFGENEEILTGGCTGSPSGDNGYFLAFGGRSLGNGFIFNNGIGGAIVQADATGNFTIATKQAGELTWNNSDYADNVKLTVGGNGNVGIGTQHPLKQLTISDDAPSTIRLENSEVGGLDMEFTLANGNLSFWGGQDGTAPGLDFLMSLNPEGKLSLGASGLLPTELAGVDISNYRLFVLGGILTEECRLRLEENWGDFVFEEDYDLMPLENVENYIQKNGHLPNTPSAEHIAENGLELGEITADQQIKIEELFLHIIELNKKVQILEKQIEELSKE